MIPITHIEEYNGVDVIFLQTRSVHYKIWYTSDVYNMLTLLPDTCNLMEANTAVFDLVLKIICKFCY